MDVQKYIKRLKFARADRSRETGPFETRDEVVNFLNQREFFFGDPFVVKYDDREDGGKTKLLLAIGKSPNQPVNRQTAEVQGISGPNAYELFDISDVRSQLEELWKAINDEVSARTESDAALQEQVDDVKASIEAIENIIEELSGSTEYIEELVGEGWMDAPDNVSITDRIKRDEELSGIEWGHKEGHSYNGSLPNVNLPFASGESLASMVETISDTLGEVLFVEGGVPKTIKFDYSEEKNILYYTAGTQNGSIELSQASVVKDAYYDPETEELVIIFNLGEGKEQVVRIPIGGLINEWETADTNTVHLNKTRVIEGKDVLTADVIVSDDADNMLVAKNDGLYVSNSGVTKLENILDNVKGVLKLEEDGHLPEGSFTGSHTHNAPTYCDAVNILDSGLTSAETATQELSNDVNAKYAELNSKIDAGDAALSGMIDSVRSELDSKIDAGDAALSGMIENINNELNNKVDEEIAARESVKLVELPQQQLEPNVRAAYILNNNGVTGDTVIKVYKDSVVYKVYIGHVDDRIVSPSDPTVIPGTGATAICFIFYNANGEYELSANAFEWTALDDEIEERKAADNAIIASVEELSGVVESNKSETDSAINALNASVDELSGKVETNTSSIEGLSGDVLDLRQDLTGLESTVEDINSNLNTVSGNLSTLRSDFDAFSGETNQAIDDLENKVSVALTGVTNSSESSVVLNKESDNTVSGDVKISSNVNNVLEKLDNGELFVNNSGITRANTMSDELSGITLNLKQILNTSPDGHFTARFVGPHVSSADTYYAAVNSLDAAIVANEDASKATDNSFELDYDDDAQEIILKWQVDGENKSSRINVSDFVKDSFLEGVQIVTHDDVQCLEFTFKTYEGLPQPIYVPLSELAAIYRDGDGIDREALENHQIIKVKLDSTRKNWLSVSPNGLCVTGVTEAINEAVSVVQQEIDVVSSGLSQEIADRTSADQAINDKLVVTAATLSSMISSEAATRESRDNELRASLDSTASTLYGMISVETAAREAADNELRGLITAETTAREAADAEIRGDLQTTAQTLSDMITAETAARESADKELREIIDNEITARTAADEQIVEQLNEFSASTEARFEDIVEIISGVTGGTLEEYVRKDEVEDHFDSASTLPVQNGVVTNAISELQESIDDVMESLSAFTADTISVGELTAETIVTTEIVSETGKFGELTANTIVVDEISGNSAYFSSLTAGTIYADEYNNLPTATTEQYGVVILDDQLDSASTNPVENRAIFQVIKENEEIVASALNDLEERKADRSELEDLADTIEGQIDDINEQISAITESGLYDVVVEGSGNVVTSIEKRDTSVVATLGEINIEVDDHLDSASTNPVENRVIYKEITENEEVVASALNDLNERKADIDYVDDAIEDAVSHIDMDNITSSTINVENLTAQTLNTSGITANTGNINNLTAQTINTSGITANTGSINNLTAQTINTDSITASTGNINNLTAQTINTSGLTANTGNINNLTAQTINTSGLTANTGNINNLTAQTINTSGLTANTGNINNLTAQTISTDSITASTGNIDNITAQTIVTDSITASTGNIDNITAQTIVTDELTSTTISAATYNNLPTATTSQYGVVIVDDALDSGSTNPVQNSAITKTIRDNELVIAAAFNDINDRKANIEDVPTSISDLAGVENLATKSEIGNYLPLSGGTLTGGLSGTTVSADTFNAQTGFFQTSDERYKIFIGDVDSAVEKAKSIPTKYFYWKDMCDGPRQIGTSAQEVQKIFPEMVASDGEKLSVDYAKLSIVALAAIKELAAQVENLQKQLDELKK